MDGGEGERIRVMQVLEATVGGTRRHVLDLCLNLLQDQFALHLVCSTERDPSFANDIDRLRQAGVEVSVLPMVREIHPAQDWHCLQALTQLINQSHPQIVHGHSAKGGFLARLAGRRFPGLKTLYTPHCFPFQMRVSPLRRELYLALERYAAKRTDVLVAPCKSERTLALERHLLPAERVRVITNGIAMADYNVTIDRAAYREQLGVPVEALLIGSVAALTPQKGLADLVRATGAVCRERPDVHVVLAGEGPLRTTLQALADSRGVADRVHLIGQRADIPQFMAALDLFVLPSLWEGLPYALLEAGATALPVVATNIPGNRDFIQHGVTGWLATPANAIDLAVQIFAALADSRRAEKGKALRESVRQGYTLEQMLQQHTALYEELAR